jgi:hypothetical protein
LLFHQEGPVLAPQFERLEFVPVLQFQHAVGAES